MDLAQIPDECRAVAVELQKGQWRPALGRIQALAPAIHAGLQQLAQCAQTRGLKLDDIQLNELPLSTLIRSLQSIMQDMNRAIQARDWVTVADLLEEDLAEAVSVVHQVLTELRA